VFIPAGEDKKKNISSIISCNIDGSGLKRVYQSENGIELLSAAQDNALISFIKLSDMKIHYIDINAGGAEKIIDNYKSAVLAAPQGPYGEGFKITRGVDPVYNKPSAKAILVFHENETQKLRDMNLIPGDSYMKLFRSGGAGGNTRNNEGIDEIIIDCEEVISLGETLTNLIQAEKVSDMAMSPDLKKMALVSREEGCVRSILVVPFDMKTIKFNE
jgi:hypothetical protein